MELRWSHIALLIASLIAGVIIGASFRSCTKSPEIEPIVLRDTLTINDTIYIKEHTKPKEVVRTDTCWLPSAQDTIRDSVLVEVPITKYEFADTYTTDTSKTELNILFSGYNASIDGITLKTEYTVKPQVIEKRRGFGWSVHVGPYIGYGATVVGNRVYAAPSAGVSISVGWGYNWK